MAEPARKIYDDESDTAKTAPELKVLEGGGETTEPKQGHLKPVDKEGDDEGADLAHWEDAAGSWNTRVTAKKNGFISNYKLRKRLLIAGGIGGVVIAGFMALVSFLLPFNVPNVLESIEQKVGQVPENAVERRLEFYVTRYMMIRVLEDRGIDPRSRGFTYMGTGWFDTLYTNWKGAKLETKLIDDFGYKLEPINLDTGIGKDFTKPTEWRLVNTGVGRDSNLSNQTLDKPQVRQFIREFAREETKSYQIIKRHNMRKILKKYNGVSNWKPFEKESDAAKKKYLEKKRVFKQKLVDKTVGSLSPRYGQYLTCLIDGDKATCKKALRGETPSADSPDLPKSELDEASKEGVEEAVETTSREASEEATKGMLAKLQGVTLKQVLKKAIPVIGWVGMASQIVQTVDDGTLNEVLYARNAQQYASFTSTFLSAADQQRSGQDFDPEDIRVLSETLNNYQQSPVYQEAQRTTASAGTVSAQGSYQYRRDCNNDGDTTDTEDLLKPGETVCPDKLLLQDKTSFTDNEAWRAVVAVSDVEQSTVGAVTNFLSGIIETVLDRTGINSVIAAGMEKLGLSTLIADGFGKVMNTVFAPVMTGTETGPEAYEGLYAGYSVLQSSLGGGVGENREDTIAGQVLTAEQIGQIKSENMAQYAYRLQQKGALERYLSPTIKESLSSQFIASAPTSVSSASVTAVSNLNPSNLLKTFSSLFIKKADASTGTYNPFKAIYRGYPINHPVFTANNGLGMDPDDLNSEYSCDLPPADRPQNKAVGKVDGVPFDTFQQADPCQLEERVSEVGSMLFSGKYDDGIDTTGANVDTSAPAGAPQGGDSSNLTCQAGTDGGVQDGYQNKQLFKIRVCNVQGIIVNAQIAKQVDDMINAAKAAGITIKGGGFRDMASQQRLWRAYKAGTGNQAAEPGTSNHQMGFAIDINYSELGVSLGRCRSNPDRYPTYKWLAANAARYGLSAKVESECWHWSVTGG